MTSKLTVALVTFAMALRRVLRPLRGRALRPQLQTSAPIARSFANVSSPPRAPSRWKATALVAAGLVGGLLYLAREPPQRKEQMRLLDLAKKSAEQGDMEQALRYHNESYAAVKDLLVPGGEAVKMAILYAGMTEALGQHDAALSYYHTAMENVKLLSPISTRCAVGVGVLDKMAQCYHHLGNYDAAERTFKKALKAHEKYLLRVHPTEASHDDDATQARIDGAISNVYLHYAQLMATMDRPSEVTLIRQRLVQLLQSSPVLRREESSVVDQFDDLMTLHSLREARQRQRQDGHD